jgi:hypothetical protein
MNAPISICLTTFTHVILLAALILIASIFLTACPTYAEEDSINLPDPDDWIDYGTDFHGWP